MVHGLLRTVGIVNLQTIALSHHIVAHGLEGLGRLLGKHRYRSLVTVNAGADEIIGAVVADFQDGIRHGIGKQDEVAAVVSGRNFSGFFAGRQYTYEGCSDDK